MAKYSRKQRGILRRSKRYGLIVFNPPKLDPKLDIYELLEEIKKTRIMLTPEQGPEKIELISFGAMKKIIK